MGRRGHARNGEGLLKPAALALVLSALPAAAQDYPVPAPPAVSTSATLAYYWADHADYDTRGQQLHLKGNVLIHESTYTVKADELWLDNETHVARSQGFMMIDDGVTAVYGDSGHFDMAEQSGLLEHPSAGHGDWRIHARKARLEELRDKKGRPYRKIDYWSANFTSCNVRPPHYHFHASHLKVYPGRYLIGYNDLYYIGRFPLFYSPILYHSLVPGKEDDLGIKFQPGYDKRNGGFLKATQTHGWTPHTYSKLFLDWYSTQGFGEGAEIEHKTRTERTMLYGYHVRENVTHNERWAMLGDVYQPLGSSFTVQGRLQEQSDPLFNNNYARANTFMVTPQLINSGALLYRTKVYTARVAYNSVQDAYLLGTHTLAPAQTPFSQVKYLQTTQDAPNVTFQTIPLKFWKIPWLNSFNASANNNYTLGRTFLQKTVSGGWEGTRAIPLIKGRLSMTPRVAYNQTFYNEFDELANSTGTLGLVSQKFVNTSVGRYTAGNTFRLETLAGKLDLGYTYTRRLTPDTFNADVNASDHGVETNLVTLEDAFRPTRRVFVRATTGYDFRTFFFQTLQARDRIQPVTAEVYYTPRASLTLSLRDDYQVDLGNRSFLADAAFGDVKGTFVEGQAGYNRAEANTYISSVLVGYEPSTYTWRVTAALRSTVFSNGGPSQLSRLILFDKEMTVVKRWHDFYGQALVRLRPGDVREFSIRVQMRFPSGTSHAERRDWESEWFPERKQGAVDRP